MLTLAGCSHANDATSAHDPCSLLTKADVEAVTHKPVAAVASVDETHCAYGPKGGGPDVITVEAAWSGADAQFQAGGIASSLMHDAEKAPKVGDASYATAMGNVFYARKGNAYVAIDMRAATVPVKTVGPELARRALSRMGQAVRR
jgi:hypothetical protein